MFIVIPGHTQGPGDGTGAGDFMLLARRSYIVRYSHEVGLVGEYRTGGRTEVPEISERSSACPAG